MESGSLKREHLWGLNSIRVICALMVLFFHISNNLNISFGLFSEIVIQANTWMTSFFILSGFVLWYSYQDKDLTDLENIKSFVKKRFMGLYPCYVASWIFVTMLWGIPFNSVDVYVFPFQLTMLHAFNNYGYLANGGTWFFSCITFCYLVFPYLHTLIKKATYKNVWQFMLIIIGFEFVIPRIHRAFGIEIYTNIFCRIIEFAFGVLLCKFLFESEWFIKLKKKDFSKIGFVMPIIGWVVFYLGIVVLSRFVPAVAENIHNINVYAMVAISGVIILTLLDNSKVSKAFNNSWLINTLSSASLEFWAVQFFIIQLGIFIVLPLTETMKYQSLIVIVVITIANFIVSLIAYKMRKLVLPKMLEYSLFKILFGTAVLMIVLYLFRGFVFGHIVNLVLSIG